MKFSPEQDIVSAAAVEPSTTEIHCAVADDAFGIRKRVQPETPIAAANVQYA